MARTRSGRAHRAVMDAAIELVIERGVDGTSMDAIAGCSGVSKATIYKHWSNKDALMLEMMADISQLKTRPVFDSGNVRADIIAVLAYRPNEGAETREKVLPQLMAYGATNPEFGFAWRNMVMEPPRRELKLLLKKAIAAGELTADLDLDMCLAILLGPIIYWYVFLRRKTQAPSALAEAVTDTLWRAYSIKRKGRASELRASR